MSRIDKTTYQAKYGDNTGLARFQDNVSGDIGANDMREYSADHKDSVMFLTDNFQTVTPVVTSGGTITIPLGSYTTDEVKVKQVFEGSASIAANKTLAITGDGLEFTFILQSSGAFYVECPSGTLIDTYDGRRDGTNPLRFNLTSGIWIFKGTKYGSVWAIDLFGPKS